MSMYDEVECINDDPIRTAIGEAAKSQREHYKIKIIHYGVYGVSAMESEAGVSYSVKKLSDGLFDEYLKLEVERTKATTGKELFDIDKKMLQILSRIT